MKRSTLLIIAGFIGGFLWVLGYVLYVSSERNREVSERSVILLGSPVETRDLGEVPREISYELRNWKYTSRAPIEHLKGIKVIETSQVTSAVLSASADWMPWLDTTIEDGRLTVSIDPRAMASSLLPGKDGCRYSLSTDGFIACTLLVPRGSVRSLRSTGNTLYADSIDATRLKVDIADRLVLHACRIDTLDCGNSSMKELKLEESRVGVARVDFGQKIFKITRVGDSSSPSLIDINP